MNNVPLKRRGRPKSIPAQTNFNNQVETFCDHPAINVPESWSKGELLNVRNYGGEYWVTRLYETFDPNNPVNAIHFTNTADCQQFVSEWYSAQHHDPRAR